jgi:ubiquitin carboxyl-terminal hydrolase 48
VRWLPDQASLLGAERLQGDNQYFCGFCQAKVDARRQIRLASLPPYLSVSLQRFVFDMKARPHP